MKKYILNPRYILRHEGDKSLILMKPDYQSPSTINVIHPIYAIMLSAFNGTTMEEAVDNIAEFLKIPKDIVKNKVSILINNEHIISGNSGIFPPQTIIEFNDSIIRHNYKKEQFLYTNINLKLDRLKVPSDILCNITMKCATDCSYCYADRKKNITKEIPIELLYKILDDRNKNWDYPDLMCYDSVPFDKDIAMVKILSQNMFTIKIKTVLYFICMILAGVSPVFSQNMGEISGKVTDINGVPLEFINVKVTSIDSIFIAGNVTDSLGMFSFNIDREENDIYIIELSCVGYKKVCFNSTHCNNLSFKIEENEINLKEVVVTGKTSMHKLVNGNIVSRINNSILSNIGTANDVLVHLPGVYKVNDTYTILGKRNILFYIDNREIKNMEQLDGIRSEDIITVEIISNAGARYAGDIETVVKIKTKRDNDFGILTRFRGKYGRRFSNNELLNLTYKKNRIDVFSSFYFDNTKLDTDNSNTQLINVIDTIWQTKTDAFNWSQDYSSFYGDLGINYNILSNHKISLGYNYTHNEDKYGGISTTDRYANNSLITIDQSNSSSRNKSNVNLINFSYNGSINNKMHIEGDINYMNKNSNRIQSVTNPINVYQNTISTSLFASKLILSYLYNEKSKFNIGGEASNINSKNKYSTNDDLLNKSNDNSEEHKYAVFSDYQTKYKKFGIELGLRYEYFNNVYTSNIYEPINRTYNVFFPSLNLSLPINRVNMSLSISQRTKRPTFYQLRSGIEYISQYMYEKGNPQLIPENINNINYTLAYDFIQLNAYYRHIKNYISNSIYYLDKEQRILVGSNVNYPKHREFGINLALNKKIGIWNPNWNIAFSKPVFSCFHELEDITYNKPLGNVSLNNIFQLPKKVTVNVDLFVRTHGNYSNIYLESQTYLNFGIRKIINNSFNIDLQFNDVFSSQKNKAYIDFGLTKMNIYGYQDTRKISVTITYKYLNYKNKYKRSNSAEEDLQRL